MPPEILRDPPVGSTIVWDVSHPTIRESSQSEQQPPPRVTAFGPQGLSYVQWQAAVAVAAEPVYCAGTLWGNSFVQVLNPELINCNRKWNLPLICLIFVLKFRNRWGNQGMKVGLASYHFVPPVEDEGEEPAEAEAAAGIGSAYISYENPHISWYISYENPLCAQWPPLDDGSVFISKWRFFNRKR